MTDCIFCKIIQGELPCFKVYEDDRVLAFEDINPISQGHTLIIPKQHSKDLYEIPEEDLTALHLASKKIIKAISDALNPTGVACVQLNGKGANQVVLHYHLHLIPRMPGSSGPPRIRLGNQTRRYEPDQGNRRKDSPLPWQAEIDGAK